MNRNRQVTLNDYTRCVDEQLFFLHEQDGSPMGSQNVRPVDVREFYDNSVSIDAAASDLFYRGF